MTLIPSTRPCSLDCTSLSELICNFLSSALSHFVLSTSCYIMRILLLCPLDCTSLSLICVFHTFLGSNCCLLWSVPSFHKFQFATDLFSTFKVPSLFSGSALLFQGRLNCTLDYPSVCSHYMHSDLSSSVHRTVPPILGFHHTCTSFCHAVLNCPLDCTSLVCGHLHRVHLCKILMKNVT